jgi:hypothetical protein
MDDRGYSVPLDVIVVLERMHAEKRELESFQKEAYAGVSLPSRHKGAYETVIMDLYLLDAQLNHGRKDVMSRTYERLAFHVLEGKFAEANALGTEMDGYARLHETPDVVRAIASVRGSLRVLQYEIKIPEKRPNSR